MSQTQKAAIIGAGTMGARIAAVMAAAGYQVSLYSRSAETLQKAENLVSSLVASPALHYTTDLAECLAGADFVSENIAEDITLKQNLWRTIEQQVAADCLLTTNTSSVSISLLASVLNQPERLVGMHWFNPANVMPMIEIIRGEKTAEQISQQAQQVCQQLGKEAILVNQDVPGFIINRLQYALLREALFLVSSGVGSIDDVDLAVERTLAPRWSAMGPMKLMDFAGLDTVEKVAAILLPELDNSTQLPQWLKEKVQSGQLGAKSGEGFYHWTAESASQAMQRRDQIVRDLTAKGASDE